MYFPYLYQTPCCCGLVYFHLFQIFLHFLLNTIEIVLPTAAHFMWVLIEKTSRIEAPLWIVLIER